MNDGPDRWRVPADEVLVVGITAEQLLTPPVSWSVRDLLP